MGFYTDLHQDAPQDLLPLPRGSPSTDPDETYVPPVIRGTRDWAPPRQQIIFTDHPNPKYVHRVIELKLIIILNFEMQSETGAAAAEQPMHRVRDAGLPRVCESLPLLHVFREVSLHRMSPQPNVHNPR